MDKVFAAEYNSCIYESGFSTISLHATEEGAEKAVAEHKSDVLEGWKESGYDSAPDWEQWRVSVLELKD